MARARRLASGALLLFVLATAPRLAWAQETVVLIRPSDDAPALVLEAFNRLHGELELHGFSVRVVAESEAPHPVDVGRGAGPRAAEEHRGAGRNAGPRAAEEQRGSRRSAMAAIVGVSAQGGSARVDIWLGDPARGQSHRHILQPSSDEDSATLVAVRALELLRASLREESYAPSAEAASGTAEAGDAPRRGRAKADATATPRTSSPADVTGERGDGAHEDTLWVVQLGAAWAVSMPVGGSSWGPELAVGVDGSRWGARLRGLMLLGGSYEAEPRGRFEYRASSVLVEPHWSVVRAPSPVGEARLSLVAALGATRWAVSGEVDAPFRGRDDAAWTACAGGGSDLSVLLGTSETPLALRLYASVRVLSHSPAPRVHVADEHVRLAAPLISVSTGLSGGF